MSKNLSFEPPRSIEDLLRAKKSVLTLLQQATQLFLEKQFDEAFAKITEAQQHDRAQPIYLLYKSDFRACIKLGDRKLADAEELILEFARAAPEFIRSHSQFEGDLNKRGEVNIAWKPRYFVLTHNFFLFYYKDQEERVPQGVILTYRVGVEQHKRDFMIKTARRTFKIRANNEDDAEKWVHVLSKVAKEGLRIPRHIDLEVEQAPVPKAPTVTSTNTSKSPVLEPTTSHLQLDNLESHIGSLQKDPAIEKRLTYQEEQMSKSLGLGASIVREDIGEKKSSTDRYFTDLGLSRPKNMTLAPSVPPPPFSQSSEELGDVTSFAPGDLEAGTRGYRRARPRYADGAYESNSESRSSLLSPDTLADFDDLEESDGGCCKCSLM